MLEGIPLSALTPIGMAVLVLGLPYLQMARGKLVPRSALDDVIHDRDEWRTESRVKDAQIAEKDVQLGHLKEVGLTVQQLARGLQQEMPE